MARWLVAVDDSEWAGYAFNYTTTLMNKDQDHLYLMNVCEGTQTLVGYADETVMISLCIAQEQRARKILVHYGHKAAAQGIKFTIMKGSEGRAGALLCKAVDNYKIDNLVVGRRSDTTEMERLFLGSTSKYCLENANCNVMIVKIPFGPECAKKVDAIIAEEHERIRRIEEGPAEIHDTTRQAVVNAEEIERERRMAEQASLGKTLDKFIHHYQFHDEILKLNKDKDARA